MPARATEWRGYMVPVVAACRRIKDGEDLADSDLDILNPAPKAGDWIMRRGLEIRVLDPEEAEKIQRDAGFQVCRRCGCSELDPCEPDSCSWVADDLCSSCTGEEDADETPADRERKRQVEKAQAAADRIRDRRGDHANRKD